MKKKFIVMTNPTTVEQDKVFQAWIADRFAFWHWLNDTWLLVDHSGEWTGVAIRDQAQVAFPGIFCLVIEMNQFGDLWCGFGPNGQPPEKNMFTWFRETWEG